MSLRHLDARCHVHQVSLLEESAREAEARARGAERRAAELETESEELRDRFAAAEADADARGCRLEELREALREAREGEAASRQQQEATERVESAEARQRDMLERLAEAEALADGLWSASKDAALQASAALVEAAGLREGPLSQSNAPRGTAPKPEASKAAAEAWDAARVAREALECVLEAVGASALASGTLQGGVALAVVQVHGRSLFNICSEIPPLPHVFFRSLNPKP